MKGGKVWAKIIWSNPLLCPIVELTLEQIGHLLVWWSERGLEALNSGIEPIDPINIIGSP